MAGELDDLFGGMYEADEADFAPFRKLHEGFGKHDVNVMFFGKAGDAMSRDWTPLARFTYSNDYETRQVTVEVAALPARFYRIITGEFAISTGSGREMAALAGRMAAELVRGMIGVKGVTDGK
jgi:hypothetical protein